MAKILSIFALALSLAVASFGVVYAQTASPTPTPTETEREQNVVEEATDQDDDNLMNDDETPSGAPQTGFGGAR